MTREELRAWAKGLDLPEMRLAFADEELDGRFEALTGSPGIITPSDADEIVIHSADQAHALGFNGTGVRIAIVDTGVDLTHPDLFNVSARVTDPASPYFLHPINYLSGSLNDLILFGLTPALPFGENALFNSWFVDTSFSTTVVEFNMTSWVNWTDGTTNLTWNVTGVAGLSAGEEVRLGFHPDDKFLFVAPGMRPGVLLFNGTGAGAPYDMILVDLDLDLSFVSEKPAWMNTDWATFDPMAELVTRDLDMDGFADLSGGMLTFISDGVREIPYASGHIAAMNFTYKTLFNDDTFDIWAAVGLPDPTGNIVPPAGDVVFLMGDFDVPSTQGSHGSWIASTIAGQGITGGSGTGPVISGMAPGAKIIGVGGNFDSSDPFTLQTGLYTGQIFATQGYDGVLDTGDEAHLTSNSWGGFGFGGWEWSSRFMDYVSNVLADERTLFVFAAGNDGNGYGTLSDPAGSPGVVTSGAMDNWNYRDDPWFDFEGGPNPSYGDLTSFSERGPSVLGRHKVDALTTGRFGYSADPLNDNPFIGDSGTEFNGSSSWILWSGTSLSTPNLVGVLALIYGAYMSAHGGLAPMGQTAKTILKNSADDARLDPFLAGAGIANALRGVLIANETDGLSLNVNEWNVGDYGGVDYASYANILFPGGMDMVSVDMTNHRPSASMAVDVVDAMVALNGSISTSFTRTPGSAPEEFILNATGLYALDGTLLVPDPAGLFASADFIRVSMGISRAAMEAEDVVYRMRLLDWTDVNANGSFDGFDEENLMHRDAHIVFFQFIGPNGFGLIQDPANRTHDGLIIRLEVRFEALLTSGLPFDLQVDYYKRTDFPWLEIVGPSSFVIPAASTSTVDLAVTVPGDADPGLYEAVVLFKLDDGNVTTLPVVVNVANLGLPMFFGGNTYDAGFYQQGVQYGRADTDFSSSGDYRYYFLDLPEPATVTVLLAGDNAASSNELYVLTNVTDWFSGTAPARYGPGTEALVASDILGANTAQVVAPLSKGLSIIIARSIFTASLEERVVGQAGVITVSPPDLVGLGVPVDGTETFAITSDLEFLNVSLTVATGEILNFLDLPVDPYAFPGGDFATYLFNAPNTFQTTIAAGTSRASWELFFHSGARDVDMGIFFDGNCDGTYGVADEVTGLSASTGANPETFATLSPAAGCYWVHAAGFDVDPGSLYDLTFGVITTPFIFPVDIPSTIPAGVPTDVTIEYSLPRIAGNAFGGDIALGSPQFPRAIIIPVDLTPDLPPLFANETPMDIAVPTAQPTLSVDMTDFPDAFEGMIDVDSVEVLLDGGDVTVLADITPTSVTLPLPFVIAEGRHDVTVNAADLTGSASFTSWSFDVDTVTPIIVITAPEGPITNVRDVVIEGLADPTATLTVNGTVTFVSFFGKFTTTVTLREGDNAIDVVSTDDAGNVATVTVGIELDTVAPSITLISPPSSVEVASVTIAGSTEAGASVYVNGVKVGVDATGAFSTTVALTSGSNTITAIAMDAAGNAGSTSATVTFNDPVPGLQQDLDNANEGLDAGRNVAASLQIQLFVAIAIAAIGLVLAAVLFVLWSGSRSKP